MLMNACPICGMLLLRQARPAGDGLEIDCLNCSPYFFLAGSALKVLELGYAPMERARISHGLFGRSRSPVTSHTLEDLSSTVRLPGAGDLVDNLLVCVADETGGPGGSVDIDAINWRARIGAQEVDGVIWAIEQCGALQYPEACRRLPSNRSGSASSRSPRSNQVSSNTLLRKGGWGN
jgi:hypothetical protein